MTKIADRLWRRVEKTDTCWLWQGATVAKGHGVIGLGRKSLLAHRVSWELTHGPIPAGKLVCHTCDVPNCVNPDHLYLGTMVDNGHDAWYRGQQEGRITLDAVLTYQGLPKGIKKEFAAMLGVRVTSLSRLSKRLS